MAFEQESDRFQTPVDSVKTPFRNVCDTSGLKILTQINDKTTVWPRYDKTSLLKEIRNNAKFHSVFVRQLHQQ